MIERYAVLSSRILHELGQMDQIIERIERAMHASEPPSENQDLFVDSAALNLHDLYSALERIFESIASTVDRSTPTGHEWHRELLKQMAVDVRDVRPAVISSDTVARLDDFLRFRHVVRNVYAFTRDLDRVGLLARRARPTFQAARADLVAFVDLLDDLARQ